MRSQVLMILTIVLANFFSAQSAAQSTNEASACPRKPNGTAKLEEKYLPNLFTVEGDLATFDPCHSSVSLDFPSVPAADAKSKPPLMIFVHGGVGLTDAERRMAAAIRQKGLATLIFDAFEINGFRQGAALFRAGVTNEAKQRMLLKVTLSAYKWVITQDRIDTSKIFMHGISNGGTVVVNMAGLASADHVKGIFAEGIAPGGIGLPAKLNVPVRLIFGKLDNYGGASENDWIWQRVEKCQTMRIAPEAPAGSADECNWDSFPYGTSVSSLQWYEAQRNAKADIDIWFYDNAAHSIFAGAIKRNIMYVARTSKRMAWIGADAGVSSKLVTDIDRFIRESSQ